MFYIALNQDDAKKEATEDDIEMISRVSAASALPFVLVPYLAIAAIPALVSNYFVPKLIYNTINAVKEERGVDTHGTSSFLIHLIISDIERQNRNVLRSLYCVDFSLYCTTSCCWRSGV